MAQLNARKHFVQSIIDYVRGKLSGRTGHRTDYLDTPKLSLFDYKLEHNFEMRPNPTAMHAIDGKGHARNWRYHLTAERF